VVADDTVLVGSLNWNRHSSRENREVVVALESETVARYYRKVFEADWRGGRGWGGGAGWLLGIAGVAVVAGGMIAWRRVRFEGTV
jgi:phosphatidylserine/phosphatidylglycerophosphate/cardiolipin synthase-like enzyme